MKTCWLCQGEMNPTEERIDKKGYEGVCGCLDELRMQETLRTLLEEWTISEGHETPDGGAPIQARVMEAASYDDVGMLTKDKGLVVRLADGTEYQITIRRT